MRKYLLMVLCCFALMTQGQGVYNVCDFGAKGDGKTLDSPAFNAAIQAAVQKGGGRIDVPAGSYLCGSIRLDDDIELHLMAGAKIVVVRNIRMVATPISITRSFGLMVSGMSASQGAA